MGAQEIGKISTHSDTTFPTSEEAIAIEKFALSVTLPILLDTSDGAPLLATATQFQIAGRTFLITARHIFDDLPDHTALAFPSNPMHAGISTFGSFNLAKPTEEQFDVAVMEIVDLETIAALNSGWGSLSLANVAVPSRAGVAFFVSGYPASLTTSAIKSTTGKFATAYTERLVGVPIEAKSPVDARLDLFFRYGETATSISGRKLKTPDLRGVSGASVWEFAHLTGGVWIPADAMKVVGVQSAAVHSKYFCAKNWWAVAKVLEKIDDEIANAVRSKLAEYG
jgi:hypothetical protein